MKIIAIDPGSTESAYCLYDTVEKKPIKFAKIPNGVLIDGLKGVDAEVCVIEMIACYGMPVGAEVFNTCCWIGRFEDRWYMRGISFGSPIRILRRDVKMHLCNSVKAKDGNISQALRDRFGEKGTKKSPGLLYGISKDCWAALALAVTWADKNAE